MSKSIVFGRLGVRLSLLLVVAMVPLVGQSQTCTILLHGLLRSSSSMSEIASELGGAGHHVINVAYPSRDHPIESLAEMSIGPAMAQCAEYNAINFVTHSMGGILVRQYFSRHETGRVSRVVMLGPPNKGSEVVDKLKRFDLFNWLNGPAGTQLGTGVEDLPSTLGPVEFELGVIAGTRSVNWILSTLLPGRDDGKVRVESTQVEGMCGFLILPVTHTFMMSNKTVVKAVERFLATGMFNNGEPGFTCPSA